MKATDILFAVIIGKVIGFAIGDFLKEFDISIGLYYFLALWVALPVVTVFCLWLAYLVGRKLLVVYQAAKHILVGALATVIDLKIFELFIFVFGIFIHPLLAKSISFIISISVKYWGNKYWAFGQHEKEDWHKELAQFFLITFVGLLLDVAAFSYMTKSIGPQFGLSIGLWIKVSVITAAVGAGTWNFLGYKFLVFKK